MNKEGLKKATFKDLIARKLEKEEAKNKIYEIEIPETGLTLSFRKPDETLLLSFLDEVGEETSTSDVTEMYKKLIYHSCDMFQDTEFQKELEVSDPYDAVAKVLEINERIFLGEKLMEISKMNKLEEQIKN